MSEHSYGQGGQDISQGGYPSHGGYPVQSGYDPNVGYLQPGAPGLNPAPYGQPEAGFPGMSTATPAT